MWFQMWSNNSSIPVIIIVLVHRTFPMVSFFDQRSFLTGFPRDQQRTYQDFKSVFIVTVGIVPKLQSVTKYTFLRVTRNAEKFCP